jgi:hypothetical protein
MVPIFNFTTASPSEQLIFGAERPGCDCCPLKEVPPEKTEEWIAFMKKHDIRRIYCLLEEELAYYVDDHLIATCSMAGS